MREYEHLKNGNKLKLGKFVLPKEYILEDDEDLEVYYTYNNGKHIQIQFDFINSPRAEGTVIHMGLDRQQLKILSSFFADLANQL